MDRCGQTVGMSDGYLRGSSHGLFDLDFRATLSFQACHRRLRSVSIGASGRRWSIWEDHREQ